MVCASSTNRMIGFGEAYLTGACLGLVVLVMRMWIPESLPRNGSGTDS